MISSDSSLPITARRGLIASGVGFAVLGASLLVPALAGREGQPRAADAGEPFAADIDWMVSRGLFDPVSEGSYLPNSTLTKEAAAVFLYRLAGSPAYPLPKQEPYRDVTHSSRFFKEVLWVRGQGIYYGAFDATFRPTDELTRGEVCAFLERMLRVAYERHVDAGGRPPKATVQRLADDLSAHPHRAAIEWARSVGILGPGLVKESADGGSASVGPQFHPDERLLRGEFAHLLKAAHDLFT